MELNEYQIKAFELAVTNKKEERIFGLLEESGEVAGIFKRVYRGDEQDDFRRKLVKELGDCLWYLSGVAKDHGITLDEVATTNLEILYDRRARGLIKGKGDDR